jgi:Rho GDP-dissociation inhibitor
MSSAAAAVSSCSSKEELPSQEERAEKGAGGAAEEEEEDGHVVAARRELGEASLCRGDTEAEEAGDEVEDEDEEEKAGEAIDLGPRVSIKEQLEKDKVSSAVHLAYSCLFLLLLLLKRKSCLISLFYRGYCFNS